MKCFMVKGHDKLAILNNNIFKQFIKTNSQLTIPFWANIKENKIQPVTFN